MPKMGKYCKAYMLSQLCEFSGWADQSIKTINNDLESESEDSVVYIQENYVVTEDIYLDEKIVFDAITPDWKVFCEKELGFIVPTEIHKAKDLNNH